MANVACRSEAERNRRRDLVYNLQNRREQLQASLKRGSASPGQQERRDHLLSSDLFLLPYFHLCCFFVRNFKLLLYCLECRSFVLNNCFKCRELLGRPSKGSSSQQQQSNETEATAELGTRGLMQLQDQIMQNQDTALDNMEKAIGRTKASS